MNLLLPTILAIFLSLEHTDAAYNTTEETETTEAETTQLYTSTEELAAETLPDLTDDGTIDFDDDCELEWIQTLNVGEEIDITLCGYNSDDDVEMVGITLDLPQDRWVGVGFVLNDDFDQDNPMTDVYAAIVPIDSRDIQERKLVENGNVGSQLTSTITVHSDVFEDGRRILKLLRKSKVPLEDVAESATEYEDYYNFNNWKSCDDEIKVIYAFGANAEEQWSVTANHGTDNAGYVTATLSEVSGISCKVLDDSVHKVSVISVMVISIVVLLFNE